MNWGCKQAMKYRVYELRKAQNMTTYELAAKSGVSRTIIWKLEKGEEYITTTKTLVSIADALGVTVGDLICQDV